MQSELKDNLQPFGVSSTLIYIALSPLLLLLLNSYLYQLLLFAGYTSFFLPLLCSVTCLVACYRHIRKNDRHYDRPDLKMMGIYMIVLFTGIFALDHYIRLEGGWDAWAMWNLHARLLSSADSWKNLLHPSMAWNSPDYPLLLPGINAWWLQVFKGQQSFLAYALTGTVFFLTILSLFFWSFKKTAGIAIFVALLLLSNSTFLHQSSEQGADILLGLLYLSVIILVEFFRFQNPAINLITGLLLGSVLNTKNEGILFVGLFCIIYARSIFKNIKSIGAGAFIPVACHLIYQGFYAPKGYMNRHTSLNLLQNLVAWEKYRITFLFAKEALFRNYLAIIAFILAAGWQLFTPARRSHTAILLLLTFIAYHFIYILYNFDLGWQLTTSYNRLMIQLYLPMVFKLCYDLSRIYCAEDAPATGRLL